MVTAVSISPALPGPKVNVPRLLAAVNVPPEPVKLRAKVVFEPLLPPVVVVGLV